MRLTDTEKYFPSKSEALQQHEINIQFLSRGCVIRVGCKAIPFESTDDAVKALNDYFERPYEMQEAWREILK